MEVSQKENKLAIGESRLGWVGPDGIVTYSLTPSDATLTIRSSEALQKNCFSYILTSTNLKPVKVGREDVLTLKHADQYQTL